MNPIVLKPLTRPQASILFSELRLFNRYTWGDRILTEAILDSIDRIHGLDKLWFNFGPNTDCFGGSLGDPRRFKTNYLLLNSVPQFVAYVKRVRALIDAKPF